MGSRILVVDDNRDAADSLAFLLAMEGYEVRSAHGGSEGIEAFEGFRPHAVVLDLGMPLMDGFAVAKHIRASGSRCVLIALTGWGYSEHRRRTAEAGFDHHLLKPASVPELLPILAAACAQTREGS